MAVTYRSDGTMRVVYSSTSQVGSYTLTGSTLTTLLSNNPALFPYNTLTSAVKELTAHRLVLESPREHPGFSYIDTYTFAR